MKKNIYLFSIILVLFSCQNSKHNDMNNGIDKRILQIVDSLPLCSNIQNFVTISFSSDTIGTPIIKINNAVFIPAPPEPPEPYRNILISETYWFRGYKKYNDWYIIFEQFPLNNKFDRFVVADSLQIDEEPFKKYGVYEWDGSINDNIIIEKVYRIEENDSLVFLNRDNDNVFR